MGSYVVYRAEHARSEAPSLIYLALFTGVCGTVLVAVAAEPVAIFYGRPEAMLLTLAMSPQVMMTVLAAIPVALLRAEMKLKQAGLAQLGAETVALTVGTYMAVTSRGAYALVASYLVSSAVALAGTWILSGIGLPRLRSLGSASWSSASRYGVAIVAGSTLWLVALQADNVVVGRLLGASDLGRYAVAFNFGVMPGTLLGSIIAQVAFPTFSMSKFDLLRLRKEFDSLTYLAAASILPAVAVAVADVPSAVAWLLGAGWQPAVVPLQVFLVVGAIRGMFPSAELLRSLGRVWVEPALAAMTAPLVLIAALLAAERGIETVALSVASVLVLNEMTAACLAARSAQIPLVGILRPFKAALPAAGLGLVAWIASILLPLAPSLRTVVAAVVGCSLYAVLVARGLLPGHEQLHAVVRFRREQAK